MSTMLRIGIAFVMLLAFALPGAQAVEYGLARTTDGGCVLVEWDESPTVVSSAVGCTSSEPCVWVNWTTTPPQAALAEC